MFGFVFIFSVLLSMNLGFSGDDPLKKVDRNPLKTVQLKVSPDKELDIATSDGPIKLFVFGQTYASMEDALKLYVNIDQYFITTSSKGRFDKTSKTLFYDKTIRLLALPKINKNHEYEPKMACFPHVSLASDCGDILVSTNLREAMVSWKTMQGLFNTYAAGKSAMSSSGFLSVHDVEWQSGMMRKPGDGPDGGSAY